MVVNHLLTGMILQVPLRNEVMPLISIGWNKPDLPMIYIFIFGHLLGFISLVGNHLIGFQRKETLDIQGHLLRFGMTGPPKYA